MNEKPSSSAPSVGLAGMVAGAVGVVYGDIGTSPLYAFRESLAAATGEGGVADAGVVLGVLSLILWTLIVIVTLKYVLLLLRADNHGEGGVLSLMALARGVLGEKSAWVVTFGMAGAALFYGDALITPAISVLSAVEGLKLVTDAFAPYVVSISIVVMVLLFLMQRRGTQKVARFFGPVMILWFLAMAWGGLLHIRDTPQVWQAFHPGHALRFLTQHGMASFIALGAVLLAVTGAEALYADLGHFGKKPIRIAWLGLVMPSLALNYLGQGALVLKEPSAAENAFFLLYPAWALAPMVALATLATVVASQAVITGAYSLTHQAIQLGLLPRMHIHHTSEEHSGQIYIPQVNWLLFAGVVLLIELFRSSSGLAAAYGIAVIGTMVISSTLMFVVMRHLWRWPLPLALLVVGPLIAIDLTFLAANLIKFLHGGFVPVLISVAVVVLMRTWVRGNRMIQEQLRDRHTVRALINELNHYPVARVEGTAVYLSNNGAYAPSALQQNLKHNKVLHESNILLTLRYADRPYVPDEERLEMEEISKDFLRVFMHFGYMETPHVIRGLRLLRDRGVKLDMMTTSFFVSRRHIMPSAQFGMPQWQDRIFIALSNHSSDPAEYFHIPLSRVVELGVQMTV